MMFHEFQTLLDIVQRFTNSDGLILFFKYCDKRLTIY